MKLASYTLIMLLFSITAVYADIYAYKDENGITYYTDAPVRNAVRLMKTPSADIKNVQPIKSNETSGRRDYHSIVSEKANQYDVDPSLIHAVIKTESNGNPHAVSRKGAKGLMQLMPSTASDMRVGNIFDPEENIAGGTKYLRYLLDRFNGDLTLALAAYNAGPKAVEKTGSIPHIQETRQYVKKVLSMYSGRASYPVPSNENPQTPPVSSTSVKPVKVVERNEPIYKIVTENGATLFTNSPHYKTNSKI